ncbi:MAG: iron ABC transporter permease [Chloroflexi bacterium]|nr:iron ABC transporter permease [Chloroflexota bacterium]
MDRAKALGRESKLRTAIGRNIPFALEKSNFYMLPLILILGVLIVYPLLMVIFGSFKAGGPYTASAFSLKGYISAFSNSGTFNTLWTTIWLGVLRALMAMLLAVALAWILARTDTPWTRVLEVIIWIGFFLPVQPYIMAWVFLAGGPNSILNIALMKMFPFITSPPISVYGLGGIIWLTLLKYPSVIVLLITPAFRGMDASLEESSRMSGAGVVRTLTRVTLPILAPSLLAGFLMALIKIMESFEVEMLLGYNAGIFVYSTRVYALIGSLPADFPQGMALSTVFLAIIMVLIVMQWRLLRQKEFSTISGRGFAVRPSRLGKYKYLTLGILLVYILLAIVLPLGGMIVGSFSKMFGLVTSSSWTGSNWYHVLFREPNFWKAMKNSLVLGLSAGTIGMIGYALISYLVVRTKVAGRKAVDVITWLPWGVPTMVFALGMLWAYIGGLPLKFLYGTMTLLVLVQVVTNFPFGTQVMSGSMRQVGKELEESSRIHGGTWFQTFKNIVVPLLAPSFVSAWIVMFLLSFKDLTSIIFLYSSDTTPLSALMFNYWIYGEQTERAVVIGVIQTVVILLFAILSRWIGARQELVASA